MSEHSALMLVTMETIVVAPAGSSSVALTDSVSTAGTRTAIPAPTAAKAKKKRNPRRGPGNVVPVVDSWRKEVLIVGHLSRLGRLTCGEG